jgi:protein TonB
MLLRLLESRRARRFAGGALLASVSIHAASVGAAAGGGARAGRASEEFISIRYLLPPDRVEAPLGERVRFVAVGAGTSGWMTGTDPMAAVAPVAGTRDPQQATRPPEPVDDGDQALATALYTEDQVDSAAVRDPNSAGPSYPDVLREQGVQGEVLVEFTVDTTGRADPGSFEVVQASHPLFAQAVREALPRMLFSPAVAHGQRVRQLVRLPMKFRLMVQDKSTI